MTLESDLQAAGFKSDILVSTSFGGVMHLRDVVQRPVFLVKSGPAMAPVAGLAYVEAEAPAYVSEDSAATTKSGGGELPASFG